jgi:ubiquinone/menaquinone biosynthesis C-methylase UbiE
MPLMPDDPQRVAADFDVRAARYSGSQWHRAYAEGLIAHSPIRAGDRVLDAGVGTGFAAIAAAMRIGPNGHVTGVDVSAGMLQQARAAVEAAQIGNIALLQEDACDLRALRASSFDAVICSAALLYMPVQRALTEWRRLLKPGGVIGFSTMRAGFPQAARLFRTCAAEFGLRLADASAALGSESAAMAALRQAGFVNTTVAADRVAFSESDLSCAWESNLRSAAHGDVRNLGRADLDALRSQFERALDEALRNDSSFAVADVLYAYGMKSTEGVIA